MPAALSFNATDEVTAVEPQTVVLQSTGSAVLRVSELRITEGSFTLTPAAAKGCPAAPFDLMPRQDCALAIGWSATAPGAEAGMLEIDTSAAAVPLQVALQAVRAAAVPPPPAPSGISNVGAGGCSIARGETLADPTLWLLMLLAAGVLWRRRIVG